MRVSHIASSYRCVLCNAACATYDYQRVFRFFSRENANYHSVFRRRQKTKSGTRAQGSIRLVCRKISAVAGSSTAFVIHSTCVVICINDLKFGKYVYVSVVKC